MYINAILIYIANLSFWVILVFMTSAIMGNYYSAVPGVIGWLAVDVLIERLMLRPDRLAKKLEARQKELQQSHQALLDMRQNMEVEK